MRDAVKLGSRILIGTSARQTVLRHTSVQARNKSWFKGFGSGRNRAVKADGIEVIEDHQAVANGEAAPRRTRSVTEEADIDRSRLAEKFKQAVGNEFGAGDLPFLNSIYLQLNQGKGLVDSPTVDTLLQKTADVLLENRDVQFPEYVSVLVQSASQANSSVSEKALVKVVLLLASRSNKGSTMLEETLKSLSKTGRTFSGDFILSLMEGLHQYSFISLNAFEAVGSFALDQKLAVPDSFYKDLVAYVEKLYEKTQPKVHEFKVKERNLFRVQEAVANVLGGMDLHKQSPDTILLVLKLASDLCSAGRSDFLDEKRVQLLTHLNSLPADDVTGVFVREDSEDLFESFVVLCLEKGYHKMTRAVFDSVVKNKMFYSAETIIQAESYLHLFEEDEQALMGKLLEYVETENATDPTTLYLKLLEVFVCSGKVDSNGTFVKELTNVFEDKGVYIPLEAYKLRLDAAMNHGHYHTVVKIFEQSLQNHVLWAEESNSVVVLKTLNDVIISGCKTIESTEELFTLFSKVKQHMNDTQANVFAITEMAKRMLAVEYVGDCIEMLKRELRIKTKSKSKAPKAPSGESHGAPYRQLFDLLHDFVIDYTAEETFETNWVLYSSLHTMFHIPYESYLPAMKFFCERNRLNASLAIFKKIQELSETTSHTLPPSREMYMYLFDQFGNKLYKDGVDEIHEYLKLDVAIPKQDLELQNSILNAYCNLQEVGKVKELFLTMNPMKNSLNSETSINEDTAKIVIKAYTYSDLGLVKTFWNNLSRFGVFPNDDLFRQYLIAHVYHGFPEEAIALTTSEMQDYNIGMSDKTLVSLHNFCLTPQDQQKIQQWAAKEHPQLWETVKAQNLLITATEYVPETSMLVESAGGIVKA